MKVEVPFAKAERTLQKYKDPTSVFLFRLFRACLFIFLFICLYDKFYFIKIRKFSSLKIARLNYINNGIISDNEK